MGKMEQPDLTPIIIDGPPWEKKHELGFFVAFVETLKAFIMHPAKTYSVMRRKAGISDALVYTVAIQVFTFLWTFALSDSNPEMFLPQSPELREMIDLPDNFGQLMILIYPISVILLQFVSAFALHLSLKWRNLQSYDFQLIFRIVAYATGSAAMLMILPIIGGLLSFFMTIYIAYVGLRIIYAMDLASFVITSAMSFFITLGLYILIVLGVSILLVFLSILI